MARPIAVLVMSAQPLTRLGLRHLLTVERGFRVVAECPSPRDVRLFASRLRPDVILLDVVASSGEVRAAEIHDLVRRQGRHVVVVADTAVWRKRVDLVNLGVAAVVHREGDPLLLLHAVRRATRSAVQPVEELVAASAGVPERSTPDGPGPVAMPPITHREAQVLEYVVQGVLTREIATQVGISQSTVRFHVRSLLRKFQAKNRAQLAYLATKGRLA